MKLRAEANGKRNCDFRRLARDLIRPGPGAPDRGAGDFETVHFVRVRIKQLRALLRLLRPLTGKNFFQRHNRELRDAARRLSAHRDEQVLLATCSYLSERKMSASTQAFLTDAQQCFAAIERRRDRSSPARLRQARNVMRRVAGELQTLARVESELSIVASGLRHTYRRARRGWQTAWADRSVESFHELRKRVKSLYYQLEMLQPILEKQARKQASGLDRLGKGLGHLHDLALLEVRLATVAERELTERGRERFHDFLARRSNKLKRRALRNGGGLFAKTSGRWLRSVLGSAVGGSAG